MAIQITPTWNEQYFTPRAKPSYRMSKLQRYMAKRWHEEIIKVLKLYPQNKFFKDIGILLLEDRKWYKIQGQVLPELTDLSYGLPVPLTGKHTKRVYGDFFTQGVGAMQLTTEGEEVPFTIFRELVDLVFKRKLKFGDVAYTEGGRIDQPTLYLSNEKSIIYNLRFSRQFTSVRRFTFSLNGGVSRKRFLPDLA